VTALELEVRVEVLERLQRDLGRVLVHTLPVEMVKGIAALKGDTASALTVAREELSAAEDREMALPFCIESGDRVDSCGCGVCA
jgi:hypothetical protein